MTSRHLISLLVVASLLPLQTVHAQTSATAILAPQATFSCGTDMQTYVAHSLENHTGMGIRCVKWSDGDLKHPNIPGFAWYGEGSWDGYTYRHIGQAYPTKKDVYRGFAADITGNGEHYNGQYKDLLVQVIDQNTIKVTGGWNEEWTAVSSTPYTALPTPTVCGPDFQTYQAKSIETYRHRNSSQKSLTDRQGEGIRCVMKTGPRGTTWFGVGNWDGKAYSHLVTGSTKGYGASDFCGNDKDFCSTMAYGTMLRRFSSILQQVVVDGWNEVWLPKR